MKRFTFKGNVWVFSVISKCFVSTQPRFLFTGNSGVCVCVCGWFQGFSLGGGGGALFCLVWHKEAVWPPRSSNNMGRFWGTKDPELWVAEHVSDTGVLGILGCYTGRETPRSDVTTGGSKQLTCTTGSNISKVQKSCCPCRYLEPKTWKCSISKKIHFKEVLHVCLFVCLVDGEMVFPSSENNPVEICFYATSPLSRWFHLKLTTADESDVEHTLKRGVTSSGAFGSRSELVWFRLHRHKSLQKKNVPFCYFNHQLN